MSFLEASKNLLYVLFQRDFVVAFWSNLLAGLMVAAALAFLAHYFTNWFKTPKLILVVKQGQFYRNNISLTRQKNGDLMGSFRLAIKNVGNQTLKTGEGYWHVYFPNADTVRPLDGADVFVVPNEGAHLRDIIQSPIYPDSFLDFGPEYKILIKKEALASTSIKYFFETDYGYFPSTVKLNPDTGMVLYVDMGSINFEFSEE